MRLLQNHSIDSNISRYQRPKPILPQLKNYLAEDSIIQASQLKESNYDLSYLIPKQIIQNVNSYSNNQSIFNQYYQRKQEIKSDREFQPFFNERDRLGKLLSKSKVTVQGIGAKQDDSETLVQSKSMRRTNKMDSLSLKRETSLDYSGKNKKGSLQLNTVAIMHLNEFYQQSIDQNRMNKELQNYQLDELVEDQMPDDLIKLSTEEENHNISQIIKRNQDTNTSKLSIGIDQTERNTKGQQPFIKSIKSKCSYLNDVTQIFRKQENFTQEDDKLMQDIARMYTKSKKKISLQVFIFIDLFTYEDLYQFSLTQYNLITLFQILIEIMKRKKETFPCIGQYDVTKSDSIKFKKSPNAFISSKDVNKFHPNQKEAKDSVEQFMIQLKKKKNNHSQSQKILHNPSTTRNKQESDDASLPPLNLKKMKIKYEPQNNDEGAFFDQMNQDFYKHPQEFSEKLKWAQKKVQKMQNDLKTWDERCKQHFQEAPKDLMNS